MSDFATRDLHFAMAYGILAARRLSRWDFRARCSPPRAGRTIPSICSSGRKSLLSPRWGFSRSFPTLAYLRWRRAGRSDAGFVPPEGEVARVRRILWLEAAVFAFIPLFAAAMARGYGELGH
jgi:hypothetical protein